MTPEMGAFIAQLIEALERLAVTLARIEARIAGLEAVVARKD